MGIYEYQHDHASMDTQETIDRLTAYNKAIGAWLWAGLGFCLAFLWVLDTASNVALWRRRSRAAIGVYTHHTVDRKMKYMGKYHTRSSPRAFEALVRKLTIVKPKILEKMHMGSVKGFLVIFMYLNLNVALAFIIHNREINWIAHHCAQLCFANLPLIIGLAGKNNVITLATGIPYQDLNTLHRWSARVFICLSCIHVAGRIYVNVPSANPQGPGQAFVRWGWAGWTCFATAILMASRPFRNRAYQFFHYMHVALILMAMVSMYMHRPQRYGWLLAGAIIWSLDRVARFLRLSSHIVMKKLNGKRGETLAWIECVTDDTIRVTVRTYQTWAPGQHAYLHIPTISPSGHPFSIASTSLDIKQTSDVDPVWADQQFIIRVRGGFTRHLYEAAHGERHVRILPAKHSETVPPAMRLRFSVIPEMTKVQALMSPQEPKIVEVPDYHSSDDEKRETRLRRIGEPLVIPPIAFSPSIGFSLASPRSRRSPKSPRSPRSIQTVTRTSALSPRVSHSLRSPTPMSASKSPKSPKNSTSWLRRLSRVPKSPDLEALPAPQEPPQTLRHGRVPYPWKGVYAWTEGPYGTRSRLGEEFQTLLLVTGGSGVSYALPIMRDVVRRARAMRMDEADSIVVTERLVFVWVIRHPDHVKWIEEDLEEAMRLAPPGLLHIRIFVSRPDKIPKGRLWEPGHEDRRPQRFLLADSKESLAHAVNRNNMHGGGKGIVVPTDSLRKTMEADSPIFLPLARHDTAASESSVYSSDSGATMPVNTPAPSVVDKLFFHPGRPDLQRIVHEEVEGTAPWDWMAVGTCGPLEMGAGLSKAVSAEISPWKVLKGEARRNIHFHNEEFGW